MSRVLCRYVCESEKRLLAALSKRGIRYTCPVPLPGSARWVVFTVERARLQDRELFELAEKYKLNCLLTRKYTKRELEDAHFFTLRCDWDKLPVREESQTTWSYPCGHADGVFCRRERTGPFVCAGPFRWTGGRHWVCETGFCPPLFCDDAARDAIESAGLTGARFLPVYGENGRELPHIHELMPESVLPREALVLPENGEDCRLKPCPLCGAPHYLLSGAFRLRVRAGYLAGCGDIAATPPLFSDMYARSMLVVSRKFYELTRERSLDKALRFEPVAIEPDGQNNETGQ